MLTHGHHQEIFIVISSVCCNAETPAQSEHEVVEIFKFNLNSVWKCTGVCGAAAPQPDPDTFLL